MFFALFPRLRSIVLRGIEERDVVVLCTIRPPRSLFRLHLHTSTSKTECDIMPVYEAWDAEFLPDVELSMRISRPDTLELARLLSRTRALTVELCRSYWIPTDLRIASIDKGGSQHLLGLRVVPDDYDDDENAREDAVSQCLARAAEYLAQIQSLTISATVLSRLFDAGVDLPVLDQLVLAFEEKQSRNRLGQWSWPWGALEECVARLAPSMAQSLVIEMRCRGEERPPTIDDARTFIFDNVIPLAARFNNPVTTSTLRVRGLPGDLQDALLNALHLSGVGYDLGIVVQPGVSK
ncbi:hypothetical protein AURDEDRAFT_116676 [Auricularia subglabra TFB-10046 SS5]|nr:hypothetical protein AURDEDRAFT_116676 [Auricularia subglabra TFB-10046 SS5]